MSVYFRDLRVPSRGLDLREMTFQNVIDNVLKPSGIKIGGFPEDLFQDLTESERQDMMCNICFLIANDCRLCNNDHVFCRSCIVAWSMTFGQNAHKCPVCRCDQIEYKENEELAQRINMKSVRCLEEGCSFHSTLSEYLLHVHGKSAFSNAHVDFTCLRPRLMRTPSANENSSSQPLLSSSTRSQLLQSRTMIQQMMMLMQIEMQLRQQALVDYEQSQDSDVDQAPQHDDARVLNNQLSEINSVLATMIRSTSVAQRPSSRRRPTHRELPGSQRLRRSDAFRSAALRRLSNLSARPWRETDSVVNDDSSATDDDDDDDSDGEELAIDLSGTTPVSDAVDDFIWQQFNESSVEGSDVDTFRSASENLSGTTPVNDAVDDFIWQQLNESSIEGTDVDIVRSPSENIPASSPVPDIQSIPSLQSLPDFQSIPSISSVRSNLSVSSVTTMNSYTPTVSSSISHNGRPISSEYVLCVNCQRDMAEGQCSCHLCTSFDNVAANNGDSLVHRSLHDIRPNPSVMAGNIALDPRPRQVGIMSPSTRIDCGAAACEPSLSDSINNGYYQSYSPSAAASRHTLPPLVPSGRGSSLLLSSWPVVGHESTQHLVPTTSTPSLLPGTHRPHHLNYAARLRWQASEMAHLQSDVSIQPWPFPDNAAGSRLTSASAFAGRRAGPSTGTTRQLSTSLSARHSSVASPAPQLGSSLRGRPTRHSRYYTSLGGNHNRLSRP